MKKQIKPRIVSIELHRSKRCANKAHALAILHPCGHKRYIGATYWPLEFKDIPYNVKSITRVQYVKIIKVIEYEVTEQLDCNELPCNDNPFSLDWSSPSVLEDTEQEFGVMDEL